MTYPRAEYIGDLIARRMSRRALLLGIGATGALSSVRGWAQDAPSPTSLTFEEIGHGIGPGQVVAPGHDAHVLIRWGDPLFKDSPAFDAENQTPEAQARQFGINCDFVAFYPDRRNRDRGVLCVNNEHAFPGQMFADYVRGSTLEPARGAKMARTAMEAVGISIVELARARDGWRPDLGGRNRRITATTPILLSGPAAGDDRVKTKADPDGRMVLGTFGNCAGGKTPWRTYLTCEEGIGLYFSGAIDADHPEAANHAAFGLPWFPTLTWWADADERFDLARNPAEPNRFGWVVEIDPNDPASTPKKRTALGRFCHEAASAVIAEDGRAVVYMGDDSPFQFLYRFVTTRPVDLENAGDALDDGVLFVARFDADGSLAWLPLVHGAAPLDASNNFNLQADVLIDARRAAAILGATPLDRPEDVEVNPASGSIFVVLTGDNSRVAEQIDAANPRAANRYGHVLRLDPPKQDGKVRHGAEQFSWDVFILCGDPADDRIGAAYHAKMSRNGWLANPDNCAFDSKGRLWLATDHGDNVDHADGLWACDTRGDGARLMRHFYRCPAGGEVCGPEFADRDRTLFLAVQHPGVSGEWTVARPLSRWPDFDPRTPPRPSVVVVTRNDGGPIGG